MAPERTSRPRGMGLPGMRNSALATAALTSVALLSQTADSVPLAGDDTPSREEVEQRINTLYDRAETDSGTYNATRAMSTGTRKRVTPAADTPRRNSDPALDNVARQWFDGARSRLGPTVPAVLPRDRMLPEERPQARPARPAPERQETGRPVLELTAGPAPVRELTAGPAPVPELTAGPVAALPAAPAAQPETAVALPAPATESRRTALRTSKEQNQRKLAAARELLSRQIAQQSRPVAALESGPAAQDSWLATPEPTRYESQPASDAWLTTPQPTGVVATPLEATPATGSWLTTPQPTGLTATPLEAQPATDAWLTTPQPTALQAAPLAAPQATDSWLTLPVPTRSEPEQPVWQQQQPSPTTGTSTAVEAAWPAGAVSAPAPVGDRKAERALAFARAQIGRPCVWGATGPESYDCSSLTQAAWKTAGVVLPRTALDQTRTGTSIPLTVVQPGDLIFFNDDLGHVGLYTGNGMMIHAPGPGTYIREESVYFAGESAIRGAVRLA